jgi:5-(carboxyamino)imidazole ribonucleotide mutase
MAIGVPGAKNAGLLAAQILGAFDTRIYDRLQTRKNKITKTVSEVELTL